MAWHSKKIKPQRKEFFSEKDNHTGVMICLVPPTYIANALTLPVGTGETEPLETDEIHMTLAYLGDMNSSGIDLAKLQNVIKEFAMNHRPIGAAINGAARFSAPEEEMTAVVALVDSPLLPEFRQDLIDALQRSNIPVVLNHGFTPHITMAYVPKDEPVTINTPPEGSLEFDQIWIAYGGNWQSYPLMYSAMEKKGFSVFKQADGAYRWITISSSAFRDRDGEIVTAKALADDVERCDTNKSYGPLRWWHIGGWDAPDGLDHWESWKAAAGVDLGSCDFNMLHGKMLIESGTFKDEITGKAFSEIQDNLEVSIAFAHPATQPGTTKQYNDIHRFERSLLPAGMASNLLTKTYVMKGVSMKTSEKLAALVAILKGKPDLAQQILSDAASIQKAAEDAGLEFKEVSEMISGEVPTEQPEVVPPTEQVPEVPDPVAETKAAPVAPAVPPEPVEIGDWSPEQLTTFIVRVMQASMAKKEADDSARQQALNDALLTIKSQSEQITALDHTLKETQKSLFDLADARPVGVKQLQASRPTESPSNVVANVASGPQFDPDFMKFMRGGN